MNENETLDNYTEINEISKSIETDTYTLESAINDLSSLTNVFDVIENAKTLDQSTTDISTIAIEGIYKRLNYKPKFLSLESYEDKNNRTLNTTLSLEGIFKSISDTFKRIWDFIKKIAEKISDYIRLALKGLGYHAGLSDFENMVFKDGLYFTDNNFSLNNCLKDIVDIEDTAKFLLNHDFVNYGNQIANTMKNMVNKINNTKDVNELEKFLVESLEAIRNLDTEKTKKYIYEITVGLESRIIYNSFSSDKAKNIYFNRNIMIANIYIKLKT